MKEDILNTARDLFADKGYHATSIIEIAEALGISTGTIMYHFNTKEKILQTILDRHNESFLECLLHTVNSTEVSEHAVKNFIAAFFAHIETNISGWRVFMQMSMGRDSEKAAALAGLPMFNNILKFVLKKNGSGSDGPAAELLAAQLPPLLFGAAWTRITQNQDPAELEHGVLAFLRETGARQKPKKRGRAGRSKEAEAPAEQQAYIQTQKRQAAGSCDGREPRFFLVGAKKHREES